MQYVNLKVHTEYTFLEGVSKIEQYIEKAKSLNMTSLGICDNAMYSTFKFYNLCKENNIKPIIGLELKLKGKYTDKFYTITVYAKNYNGYLALFKLSRSYKKIKDKRANYIELNEIYDYRDNLIIVIGGFNSEIYELTTKGEYDKASLYINEIVGEYNCYLELMAIQIDKGIVLKYIEYSKDNNIPLVLTNDAYYDDISKNNLQDIVMRIKGDVGYTPKDMCIKSIEDIKRDLEYIEEEILKDAIINTQKISDECNVEIPKYNIELPKIDKNLKELVYSKMYEKYSSITQEIKNRIDYELNVIEKMGFNSYFLIVYDIVKYAKENNILIGPGRGSASGSIISYILDITKVDPIKYNLIFERFLNIDRVSMPDIDLDIEANKKDQIIRYVMNKYGKKNVSNIVVFSKLKEKALKSDLKRINRLNEKNISYLIDNVRHPSIHASGVIISKDELDNIVPYYTDDIQGINITEYDMQDLEKIGLLKIDFLALSNLDLLAQVSSKTNIDIDTIKLNDKKTYNLYNTKKTIGIFQSESLGMTKLLHDVKINSIEDISLCLALYRPGPLGQGFVDNLIQAKRKNLIVKNKIDKLNNILKETYGYIIYQEQVMEIFKNIAGFTMSEADELRRAISKKKPKLLEKLKEKFVTQAILNGYNKKDILELYEKIRHFSDYAFNKSHSISYAILSYYTAYFKANFKNEFILCCLNNDIIKHNKYTRLILENVDINKPNINISEHKYILYNNEIFYALGYIKDVNMQFAQKIVGERDLNGKFVDINDFCSRMIEYGLNEKNFVALAYSGAFDDFGISRKELVKNCSEILQKGREKYAQSNDVAKLVFYNSQINTFEYIPKEIEEFDEKTIISNEIYYTYIPFSDSNIFSIDSSIFNQTNYTLDFVGKYEKYKLSINDKEYITTKELKEYEYSLCVVKTKGKYIQEIYKIDNIDKLESTIAINLDNIKDKEQLKNLLNKYKGGRCKCVFFENSRVLKSNDIYINLSVSLLSQLNNNFVITLKL